MNQVFGRPAGSRGNVVDPAPYHRHHVFFCTNVRPGRHPPGCCSSKGSVKLRDYAKARAMELGLKNVRVNSAGCLDCCELGPTTVNHPEGVWYTCGSVEDIDEILRTHLADGGRVARLMLHPDQRLPTQE